MVGPCYFFFNKRYIFIFLNLILAGFSLVVARGHCPPGGVQAVGHTAPQLWHTDGVATQRVASSRARVPSVSPALVSGFLTTGLPESGCLFYI